MSVDISFKQIREWKESYAQNPSNVFKRNLLSGSDIKQSSIDSVELASCLPVFNIEIKSAEIKAQKKTGRCWLFSALNALRPGVIKAHSLRNDFSFSVNYLYFWDKLEKANRFLEEIISHIDSLESDRIRSLMRYPINEGGQWFMFKNLVDKYGLVPQECMPETFSSEDSGNLNQVLFFYLRGCACELKKHAATVTEEELRNAKRSMLETVYSILVNVLGEPPEEINWEYYDAEGKYQKLSGMTPKEFAADFVGASLEDYVTIANYPTSDKPLGKTYTIPGHTNMAGLGNSLYLNLEMDEVKELLIKQLKGGEPVWFGCDCMKLMDRAKGAMSTRLYRYDELFGVAMEFSKEEILENFMSEPNHNMLISGVELAEETPRKWKVENSWGPEVGHKGFYVMEDDFLEKYSFLYVINKKYLTDEQLSALENKPIELPYWDLMGV